MLLKNSRESSEQLLQDYRSSLQRARQLPLSSFLYGYDVVGRMHDREEANQDILRTFFIDLQKAYCCLGNISLCEAQNRLCVPLEMITVIRQFHDRIRNRVHIGGGGRSRWFKVSHCLQYGRGLSPIAGVLYIV